MNTALINVRVEPSLKTKAKNLAEELGFSLSSLVNAYLRHFTRTKTVYFSVNERPSKMLIKAVEEARDEYREKKTYSFKNARQATAFLDDIINLKK